VKKGLGIISTMEGMVMVHDPANLETWRMMRRVPKKLGRPRTVRRRKARL
jgi:hypothetical protein